MNSERVFSRQDSERLLSHFENYLVNDESEKQPLEALKQHILKSKPVDAKKISENVVTIDSRIVLRNIGTGLSEEYHLVFPEDSDLSNRKLSVFSILGSQVIGNKVGTVFKVNSGKEQYYIIDDIIFKPVIPGNIQH